MSPTQETALNVALVSVPLLGGVALVVGLAAGRTLLALAGGNIVALSALILALAVADQCDADCGSENSAVTVLALVEGAIFCATIVQLVRRSRRGDQLP